MKKQFTALLTEAATHSGCAAWTSYPRPQLRRESWTNLNMGWKLNGEDIRVPFPPESPLSAFAGQTGSNLTYECEFVRGPAYDAPEGPGEPGKPGAHRTILHFGAVDQIAQVYVNDTLVGTHEGGYHPFSFDITRFLRYREDGPDGKPNRLEVRVTDELSQRLPYGKQRKDRGGMWYTPVSGIWQTVWLEEVPERYIRALAITADCRKVRIEVETAGGAISAGDTDSGTILVELPNGGRYEQEWRNGAIELDFGTMVDTSGEKVETRLWSPDDPYLYRARIVMGDDSVETYFALREIAIRETSGAPRVFLNGKPIFLHGVLDQGYFPDGIYLPADEGEYERDIARMQELGFNLLRKHIKIESECFYYYCDMRGMLVMQDMVNNGSYSYLRDTILPTLGFLRRSDTPRKDGRQAVPADTRQAFEEHMVGTLRALRNHPCIIAYTIFNEGWGQFESDRMYGIAKSEDPTRLYDSTSGWFAQTTSDFDSVHLYFGNRLKRPPKRRTDPKRQVEAGRSAGVRPLLLSEFGGYSLAVSGHVFNPSKAYGYGSCADGKELEDRIETRYEELVLPAIAGGLCGSVYTQLSDVEDEINGLYTYDRKVCKTDPERMRLLSARIKAAMDSLPRS